MSMEINPLGFIAALTLFLSVWMGHVAVRKIEAETVHLWKPVMLAIGLGLALEYAALTAPTRSLSMILGIAGLTLLWDAFEFKRQARRVRKGHAPANPGNPRHAAMLADPHSSAATLDVLKRDPGGRMVDTAESGELMPDRGALK